MEDQIPEVEPHLFAWTRELV